MDDPLEPLIITAWGPAATRRDGVRIVPLDMFGLRRFLRHLEQILFQVKPVIVNKNKSSYCFDKKFASLCINSAMAPRLTASWGL
jgi:hypothetical protein